MFLFENKFTQIGSSIRNDVNKLKEKFKDNDVNFIYIEIFKSVAINHHKFLGLLHEFEPKNYTFENFEKINALITNLLTSVEKQQPPLKKEGFLLLNSLLDLSQSMALDYHQINYKSETNKNLTGN